jgi:hypothetical protein
MMGGDSLVIDLGDDMAKTPLSSHRRKQLSPMIQQPIDRSVSAVDFVDSLQDPPLSFLKSLGVMYRDRAARPALLLVGEWRHGPVIFLHCSHGLAQCCCWRLHVRSLCTVGGPTACVWWRRRSSI